MATSVLVSFIFGILGGILAVAVLLFAVTRRGSIVSFSREPAPVRRNELQVLSCEKRQGGLYVRFRNEAAVPLNSVCFLVSARKNGDLVDEVEEWVYREFPAKSEAEVVLSLYDAMRSRRMDLVNVDLEIARIYGHESRACTNGHKI